MSESENNFEVLTGRLQILKKPTMWIGAVDPVEREMFVISEDRVEYRPVTYIPAFRKIQDEILDNALDALIGKRDSEGTVRVKMDDEKVSIEDDGPGIPVVKKSLSETELKNLPKEEAERLKDSYIPLIAWTRLFSGTNFRESGDKTTIGAHGVGSKAAAIFSTKFVGTTDDGNRKCVVRTFNNLETSSCRVSETSGKSGTCVEFWPDLERFKLGKIEPVYMDLMRQRLICLAMTFPKMKFYFNGKRVQASEKKFLEMFSEHVEFQAFDRGFVGVYPNSHDDFKYLTYVNGMYMARGGNHVEYITSQIVNPIRDKLVKKYKALKPADIRNKLTLVCFLRDFPNPKFDSQTKDTLTNSNGEITSYLNGQLDFDRLVKNVLRNEAIIGPVVDTFKLKEELKARQELKQTKKAKVRSDKYFPGIGEKKYLFLVEGLSAGGGLMKCLGRDGKYFFCLRGLALNAFSASLQKIAANQEIKDVLNIIGLDTTNKTEDHTINFDKIVIATDADVDGINITSMLLGWWYRLCPDLYAKRKICKLNTPIVIVKDQKDHIRKWFFTLDDFKSWEKTNTDKKLKIIYLKGLGSLTTSDLDFIIQQQGFDSLLEEYVLDENSKEYFENWLGDDSEPRKKYITDFSLDIDRI